MNNIAENNVPANNQVVEDMDIVFDYPDNNGIRILFVGNSITRHAPKAEIGWPHDWGMAASAKSKDYVHVIENHILETYPTASFCICQASAWETQYVHGSDILNRFQKAREFHADIIVMRIVENCCPKHFDFSKFKIEYEHFIDYLNQDGKAKIIITTSFWKHPADEALREIAAERKLDFVYLGELGGNPLMRADGLFEHRGVSVHPGDEGMKSIALRIIEKID